MVDSASWFEEIVMIFLIADSYGWPDVQKTVEILSALNLHSDFYKFLHISSISPYCPRRNIIASSVCEQF